MPDQRTTNGTGRPLAPLEQEPPGPVADLAQACVGFVERTLSVKLDYRPETLPLLDHYLEQVRASASERPETLVLVAQASGAYFGEVLRRRHASWWRTDRDDPSTWEVQLESAFLAIRPVEVVHAALLRQQQEEGAPEDLARLELDEEDRAAIAARLADLPAVSDAEFYALSTLLEVIDIAVEAIHARYLAAGEPEPHLGPEDYER